MVATELETICFSLANDPFNADIVDGKPQERDWM